ncbi:hypothetical protein TW86_03715 [Halomonas sp. S2151]|uniref:hypothetical protein n=1 Tax=Halomonas sp. S2151 TaxID=579478 RepID=UPI0005FA84DB|nr:hypothetical protein [Halomonas sp. S2151]KJZ17374.1 hypothetical protein TW86_03715 [Halomonas sp. S2151]
MKDLVKLLETISDERHDGNGPVVYECLPTETFGVRDDSSLITGLVLEPLVVMGYDCLSESLSELGVDAQVEMPEGGLKEGSLYIPTVINVSRDWESGVVDDWDVGLVEVTDADEIARYRKLAREEAEHLS